MPAPELLDVLMLPDFERADRIGEFWGNPTTQTFADLLIDCEEAGRSGRCSRHAAEGRPLEQEPGHWARR
jgi:hypothetical protein